MTGGGSDSLPTCEIYVFALNVNNSPAGPSRNRLSFAAIHQGLSSSESLAFYNLIQALRTSLGGGYI
jgi:hypothetical protein